MAGRIQGPLLHNNSSLVSGGDVYSSVFAKWNGNKAGKDSGWPFSFSYQTNFACKMLTMLVSYV